MERDQLPFNERTAGRYSRPGDHMFLPITRRRFFGQSFGITTGAVLARSLGLRPRDLGGRGVRGAGSTPMIVTSHTNATGQSALEEVWEALAAGG